MKYDKPQILCLDKAAFAIQGMPKPTVNTTDNAGQLDKFTVAAYESDE